MPTDKTPQPLSGAAPAPRNCLIPDELWARYDKAVDAAHSTGALKQLKNVEAEIGRMYISRELFRLAAPVAVPAEPRCIWCGQTADGHWKGLWCSDSEACTKQFTPSMDSDASSAPTRTKKLKIVHCQMGGHTHINIFTGNVNGCLGKAGDICMTNDEFEAWRSGLIEVVWEERT